MAKNISKVYLLNVPLEDDMRNTLYFANASAQQAYFQNNISKTYNNVSYQSETRTFRCPDQLDTVRQYNYIMWQNTAYSNKWFYAFIKKMTYVSDGYTDVVFEVDPLQTFMFDIEIKPSFVEREHTNDDTIGANLYPENLELGELWCNGPVENFGGISTSAVNKEYYTIIEVSQVENKGTSGTISYRWANGSHELTPSINAVERGTIPLIVGGTFAGSINGVIRSASDITRLYDNSGLSGSIINIYLLPNTLVPPFNEIILKSNPNQGMSIEMDGIGVPVATNGTINLGTFSFNRPNNLRGYVPRNNKLLAYPFNYFVISNNAGTCQTFRYEDFPNGVSFKVEGTFGVSGSTKAIPQNYRGYSSSENTLDYSINGPKYPVCSWSSDSYTNWLTQNSVNMEMSWKRAMIGGVTDVASGAVRGTMGKNPIGATAGAGLALLETGDNLINLAKDQFLAKTQANMTPDQVHGNLGAGDFMWAKYRSPFTFTPMGITQQYARICDDYLDVFGYQTNRMKVPYTAHRQNWWYTKTINANIVGNVPNEEMNKIKNAYNNGLTFWRNPSNFLNYSVSNGIV